jgi:5-methylcytosine-specific restriction endonuclease McrA
MYYLDTFSLHISTEREDRVLVRKTLGRALMMADRLRKQRGLCFYCTEAIDMSAHLDHVIPVYYGGQNKRVNLVAACRPCNLAKSTSQIEITNPYTINDYLKLQEAYEKYQSKVQDTIRAKDSRRLALLERYQPKRVRLYGIFRADLFKSV